MIKKVVNFFDEHRFILVLLVLLIVFGLFLIIKSICFLNYDFKALECDNIINEEICYTKNKKILVSPKKSKDNFFENYQEDINYLQEEYDLEDFSMHTAYFYEIASLLDWKLANGKEEIYDFFKMFCDTFDLENFYQKNIVFYDIFYPDRINLKLD